mmetsp:Transcript_19846/g.30040  ORF Transcript_19846/g.30040 Transcript_19846/m.30040 type:complete len:289 (-) Transcript_19846:213-1079(-)|eukprot:CAMPEP_0194082868 /NCGR_PEP_ID=MMETSP0149-20130528/8279_1 /TAXON_ID=122233 /ORGANISM="Chaetoceros debilis, Strain MM31A-1" /LENGTH=288 /DNA_ID=CAMNT_0038765141 /DNA_START=44 /DNA_END=910 /DNA_ORIENTATION=-
MASSNNNTLIIAAAGSAVAILAASAFMFSGGKNNNRSISVVDDNDMDPNECISPEDVIAIMDQLFMHMQNVLAQLSQQIQQIQMSGQSIPEPQLRQLLKSEFDRALEASQVEIYEKNNVDEDCLKQATWEFVQQENAQVIKAVDRFQALYENVTGIKTAGKRPKGCGGESTSLTTKSSTMKELSKEKLMDCADKYFDALTSSMVGIVKKYQDQGKNLREVDVAQAVQMEFASVANTAGEAALEKEGVTQDEFKAAIEKNQSDPEVGRHLAMLQMKQQRDMSLAGVPQP